MPRASTILVTVLVLSTGWAGAQESRKWTAEQQAAIKVIQRRGIGNQAAPWAGRTFLHIGGGHEYNPLTDQEAALLAKLPEIYTLHIASPDSLDEWLAHAQRIPGLKELKVHLSSPDAVLTVREMDEVLKLARLEELELWYCGLSDSDIAKLAALKNLRELRIGWSRLTPRAFAAMARLPELRSILIFGNFSPEPPLGSHSLPPDWGVLAKLEHLESVTLTRIELRPVECRGIGSLRSLRTLSIEVTEFDDQVLESLKRIPKLEHLQLTCPRITGRGLAGLRDAKNLKTVRVLCWQDLGASDVTFLVEYADSKAGIDFNTSLSLGELADALSVPVIGLRVERREMRFGAQVPYVLTIFTKGRAIRTERSLTDEDMKAVGRLRDLEYLSLTRDGVAVTRDGLRRLECLPKLRSLTVGFETPLDGSALAVLGTLPSLEELVLYDVALDADGLRWLETAKSLRSLEITGGQIHGDALRFLRLAQSLQQLSLRGVRFDPPRLEHLIGAPIARLVLEQCDVTDADCVHIGNCKALGSLRIVGAALTDAGIAHFDGLQNLNSLSLRTSGQITLDGLRGLRRLPRLQFIDAVGQGDTRLMDEGMSEEFGWTFQGECSCGCMDYTRPPVYDVTKDAIRDGTVMINPHDPDINQSRPSGLRFRGPMELGRLTLSAGDFPFPVRQIHFNDCHIEELILVGIVPERISRWGDTRIKRVSRSDPPARAQ